MTTGGSGTRIPFRRLTAGGNRGVGVPGDGAGRRAGLGGAVRRTRTCDNAPPLISCSTGVLEPHSTEGWLSIRLRNWA
ncbi:hypothetical protein IL992_03385 [Microbispora sp. NEAU-D428]|uniref:hypothetical protein n=1 Tax=Microbispora sitophila TaxID=2771537 RepID=UPI00186887B7|nr:hypothetical protein [Microbispora sitophila]MBE3008232.1 hypothetical protein [Microbispora sitophila]